MSSRSRGARQAMGTPGMKMRVMVGKVVISRSQCTPLTTSAGATHESFNTCTRSLGPPESQGFPVRMCVCLREYP